MRRAKRAMTKEARENVVGASMVITTSRDLSVSVATLSKTEVSGLRNNILDRSCFTSSVQGLRVSNRKKEIELY